MATGIEKAALAILFSVAGCAASTATAPEPRPMPRETPDEAVKRVLGEFGVSARIVRPWRSVNDPAPGEKSVRILLAGSPGVDVALDRDYWALAARKAGAESDTSWILNPKDEQSALNIDIGEDVHARSDEKLAASPGFTRITRHAGTVDGEAVTWRGWSDENHLYSDCSVMLAAKNDPVTRKHRVMLSVTANTEPRRSALEDSLASLQLNFSPSPSP